MTEAQNQIVKKSFPKVLAGTLSGAAILYNKFFELSPESKDFFKSTSMDRQSQMLIAAIGKIVKSIDNWDTVKPDLEALAARHIGYGLSPEHFVYFGQAFMYMLQNIFGADWTAELKDAWEAVYQRVSEVMIGVIFEGK
ncbi:MAG: globin domain-containing protein [Thermonemataceae bacterium]|nr:globin domain-containing protein [Thermonemataceae bacterium]